MKNSRDSIDILLNAPEYKYKANQLLTTIIRKVKNAPNEDTLADIFDKNIYYFVRNYFNVDIDVIREVDNGIVRNGFSGRMDYVSNKLIIEFKHWSKLKTQKDIYNANYQVMSYMKQLKDENYTAILTDGLQVQYYYYHDNSLKSGTLHDINVSDIDYIVRALLSKDTKKFSSSNIVTDFSIDSTSEYTKILAKSLYECISKNFSDKTAMLFDEWKTLFHLSDNDSGQNDDIRKRRIVLSNMLNAQISDNNSEYKSLFALQTSYAIILKLIACKILSNNGCLTDITYFSELSKISSQELRLFLERMEDGYSMPTGGIYNLFEGDFFSWYCTKNQWENSRDLFVSIKNIIATLDDYTVTSFSHEFEAIDVFKDLYLSVMPKEVRHSLGEYFTPAWVADGVVKNAIKKVDKNCWAGIDPCCGSGVFLIAMIKSIIKNIDIRGLTEGEKTNLLQDIITRVKGIDINPLSVLTARVNYFLAIAPLIGINKIEIPVYLGDSANIPKKTSIDCIQCYQYNIETRKGVIEITLPVNLVSDKEFVSKMSSIQSIVRTGDSTLVYRRLSNYVEEKCNSAILSKMHELACRLTELHENEWDDIWVRIATNFMLIAKIDNIDIIVGNPPWVKWEFLPSAYADKLKFLCNEKHMFSGQSYMGAISLNVCAPIANITASSWLTKGGVLAFLMPKTIMTQDSFEGFRNFFIDYGNKERLYLQSVDDWSKAGHPFIDIQESFLTYYYMRKEVDYRKGIPVKEIIKKSKTSMINININRTFENVINKYYMIENSLAVQYDKNRTGYTFIKGDADFSRIIGKCNYKVRTGVEFTPSEIYFLISKGPVEDGNWLFKNKLSSSSKYKAMATTNINIETKYVKPVLRGPKIKKFKMPTIDEFCIFPYKENSTELINLQDLSDESPKLLNYFIQYKDSIASQSNRSRQYACGNEFYALSKIGPYTFNKYKVAFRDNTSLDAVVVNPVVTPWGEVVMPICPKHAPFISTDINGTPISKEEAFYICGIINTNIIGEYFKSSFCKRTFSFRKINIMLPKFDIKNANHRRIARLSNLAHSEIDENKLQKIISNIEKIYLCICDENSK